MSRVWDMGFGGGKFSHAGNVASYTDQEMGSWTFAYDHLNRLMSGTPTAGAYSSPAQYLCMDYDSFGNRTQSDLQTTACKPNPTPSVFSAAYDPSTASYNAANQVGFTTVNSAVNGFAYDAAGDVTYDGANYYAYDAEGRVCATQTAPYSGGVVAYGYLYDAEGRRVAKGSITPAPLGQWPSCNPATNGFTLTESYVLGQGGERLTTTAWTGGAGGTGTWQGTNVYAAGKLIAAYDAPTAGVLYDAGSAGGLHFQLTDPLGTRRVQTNSAGEAELDCQSLPFGDQLSCFPDPNAPGNDQDEDATGMLTGIHFTGKERDAESGLDYFGARYYSSNMGRFLSPDEPFYDGDLSNPQSFNLYGYVQNNPLRNIDPDGHDCIYSAGVGSGVYVKSGDCYSGSDPGVYVNGTVTSASYNESNNSIGFTYTNDDTGNLGTGVIAGVPPPQPMDEGVAIPGDNGMGLIVGGKVGNYVLGRALGWIGGLLGRGAGEGGETTFQALWDSATSESGTGTARVATRVRSGGFAQAQEDFDALGGTSRKAGPVQIKELPNGEGRAVLRDFSSQATGNRPTIELQPSGGGAKGAQAIRYNP